ncbi:glycosyltransferase family 4 protein, partial [Mitsuokella sp.]|uniref:glycosyltransferase family 4 protein n=1 Tax=Mitsuokella sp. TaxID=2049034 RepID=UPI003D7E7839
YDPSMMQEFVDILRKEKPDIIHIWGTEFNHTRAMIDAAHKLKLHNRVVIRMQGLVSRYATDYAKGVPCDYITMKNEETKQSIQDDINEYIVRGNEEVYSLKRVSYIVGRGDWDCFYARQLNPTVKCYSLDNILRPAFYRKENQWNYEECQQRSIFVAQAHYPMKGLHILLKAVAMIRNRYPDIKIYVGGVSPFSYAHRTGYTKLLDDQIKKYNLNDNVCFLGTLTPQEMVSSYRKANIFVCPSLLDNRANCIMEALMLGVPTIASFVGGDIGAYTHGMDGFYYPAEDEWMLSGYIDKVFSDPQVAIDLSNNAKRDARKNFDSPECTVNKTITMYRDIMQHNKYE